MYRLCQRAVNRVSRHRAILSRVSAVTNTPVRTMMMVTPLIYSKNVSKNVCVTSVRSMSSMPSSGNTMDLPALSPTMEQGVIAKWYKNVGDLIKPGDLIADIETDKAVVGFEAQEEYYLAAIIVEAGSGTIPVGSPIGITVDDEAEIAAAQTHAKTLASGAGVKQDTKVEAPVATPAPAAAPATPAATKAVAPTTTYSHNLPLSPAVASLVHSNHIDISNITPTGPKGHLLKGDVLQAIQNGSVKYNPAPKKTATSTTSAPAPKQSPSDGRPMTARRRKARTYVDVPVTPATVTYHAETKAHKKASPHFTLATTVDASILNSFVATYGKDVDARAVLCMAASKAVAAIPSAPSKFDAAVYSTDTAATVSIKNAQHAKLSAFALDQAVASREGYLQIVYQSHNVAFTHELIPPTAAVAVSIGHPQLTTTIDQTNNVKAVSNITVTVAVDASVIGEDYAATVVEKIKQYASNPISLLL